VTTSITKTIKKNAPLTLKTAITAAVLLPAVTFASGYKLNEQSAAGMGSAHAGRAAIAEDASVVFYNPAAMTELDRAQMTAGFTYINATGDFTGNGTTATGGSMTGAADSDPFNNGGNYLGESFIPFFYYASPVNEKIAFGIGVYTPFGTKTDYNDGFVGGQFADKTSLISLEIQPSIAYKINDQLSVGVGIDIIYMEGELTKDLDLVPFNAELAGGYAQVVGAGGDGDAFVKSKGFINGENSPVIDSQYAGYENHYKVKGDDWATGWNLSVFYKLSDVTTLGAIYRSEIDIELKGDSEFDGADTVSVYSSANDAVVPVGALVGDFSQNTLAPQASAVPLTTPESLTLSLAHQATDQLLLQVGATWTGWSSFKDFDILATEQTAAVDISDVSANGGLDAGYIGHITEEWGDVWAFAVGGTYQLNDKLALRAGYAYDQSPVTDEYRTARVPSSDRQWLTFGAGYVVDQNLSVDVAAGYLFMYPMDLNERNRNNADQEIGLASLTGEYEIDVFGLSAQVNYKF
jgi:long-chain fatty acid transport protein